MKTCIRTCSFTWLLIAITFLNSKAWGDVTSLIFPLSEKRFLHVDILSDTLLHFVIDDKNSLPSPYVIKTDFSGPTSLTTEESGFETPFLKLTAPNSNCVGIYDKNQDVFLTEVCAPPGVHALTLSPEKTKNIYGLGEIFRVPGEVNGDFMGQVRESARENGNALMGFEGGAVANALFPIAYFLGIGYSNYAFFLDDASPQKWDFKNQPWQITSQGSNPLSWYFIGGRSLQSLRRQFMDLVGHPLVPPKKVLGLWVSEFGYRNWQEIEDKLKTLRLNHFPVDGFMLDLYWFGSFNSDRDNNNFGHLTWDTQNFPDPKNQISYFKNQEALGIGLIEEPYFNSHLSEYDDLASQGYLVKTCQNCPPLPLQSWWGSGGMIDYTNPKAAAYIHDLKRNPLDDDGVMIHWIDLGEPEESGPPSWYNGIGLGHGEIENHNLYNLKWAESIYDGFIRNHRTTRPFILSRSGGPGIQRFGAALWSGDIGSNMESLSAHLNTQMHLSLSGIDYFGCDIGGFHREGLHGDMNEVYTRWLAHSSVFDFPVRPHTDNGSKHNETSPDRIGDRETNLFNIRQRYELSPYYYSLAHRAYLYSEPIIPPLTYFFQSDEAVRTLADEKMIGPEILAATAAHLNERERDVYLPEGSWMEYHTHLWFHSRGEWFKGISEYQGSILRLPLFVRDGAIIPVMKVDNETMDILGTRTNHSKDSNLYLKTFISDMGRSSQFTVFEDDGQSNAYLSDKVARTLVDQTQLNGKILLSLSPQQGNYAGAPLRRRTIIDIELERIKVSKISFNSTLLVHRKNREELEKKDSGWTETEDSGIRIKSPIVDVTQKKNLELEE